MSAAPGDALTGVSAEQAARRLGEVARWGVSMDEVTPEMVMEWMADAARLYQAGKPRG